MGNGKAVVPANPKYNDFVDSNFTKGEISDLCSFHEGLTIRFELKSTNCPIIFFHFNFFNCLDSIQIWGTHSIERLALIQENFYKKSFGRVAAVVSTFIDELEGDVALSTMLSGYDQKYVAIKKMRLQQHTDLEEAVSTSRMHDVICVPNKNEKLEEFRTLVDTEIKNAIYSLYGNFLSSHNQ